MKNEIKIILNNQAKWQKNRAKLSWSEKLDQSLVLRETGIELRKGYEVHAHANIVAEDSTEYDAEKDLTND